MTRNHPPYKFSWLCYSNPVAMSCRQKCSETVLRDEEGFGVGVCRLMSDKCPDAIGYTLPSTTTSGPQPQCIWTPDDMGDQCCDNECPSTLVDGLHQLGINSSYKPPRYVGSVPIVTHSAPAPAPAPASRPPPVSTTDYVIADTKQIVTDGVHDAEDTVVDLWNSMGL